jgi:hypothetical protein
MYAARGLKKPFFWATNEIVYFRLTHVRFFSEAAVRNNVLTLKPGARRRHSRRVQDMKKTFAALAAVATIAGSLAATPASAQRGVAAGVAAGLIGGAIIGGAIASSRPAYGGPVYVEEAPYPACRMVRERFWDGYDWRYRRVEVCH